MKEPHTALFVAQMVVGKTHLALDLLVKEYKNHFDFITVICSMLKYNKTYRSRKWFWDDSNNKKRSHTQLDSRKQVIAFQDRVITINIKEAQHPLK